MSKYYEEFSLVYPIKALESAEDRFIGDAWEISNENGKFYFYYVSGQLEGKENKIEIDKDDFLSMKEGIITFDQMCRKYNVN